MCKTGKASTVAALQAHCLVDDRGDVLNETALTGAKTIRSEGQRDRELHWLAAVEDWLRQETVAGILYNRRAIPLRPHQYKDRWGDKREAHLYYINHFRHWHKPGGPVASASPHLKVAELARYSCRPVFVFSLCLLLRATFTAFVGSYPEFNFALVHRYPFVAKTRLVLYIVPHSVFLCLFVTSLGR